jgi:CheY-specific phosphatase CheX
MSRDVDNLELEEVVAIINIKGALTGMFVMAFDERLARTLVSRFAMDELEPDEVDEYLIDTMSEIANIVLGNTLNVMVEINNLLTIGTPMTLRHSGKHHLAFAGSEMWSIPTETDEGCYTLSLLVSEVAR